MSKGDGRRVIRVERALREVISSYLISNSRLSLPAMVSVPAVKASKDLRQAKVYVSVIGADLPEGVVDECIEILNENHADIQGHVGRELKMKFCPKLRFFGDEVQQAAIKVDALIRDVSTTQESEES